MRSRPNSPGRLVVALALALPLAVAGGASAADARLAGARAAVRDLARAGEWPVGESRGVLLRLEEETRRFLEAPRDAAAGGELVATLDALHAGLSARLDAMREEVMERDGDLEILFATAAYRDRQILALTALYHLSWARYQQALLLGSGGAERRELLRRAVDGFTQFVLVNDVPDIYADSLYGRALAFAALGETAKATEDLRAVLDLGKRHATHARAAAALEAIRRGQTPPGARAAADPEARWRRLEELLAPGRGARDARGKAEDEAIGLARTLARTGRTAAARAERLVRAAGERAFTSFLLAELATDRGDHAAAYDHYAAAARAADPDADRYRERARFGAAAARYRAGRHAAAVAGFTEFLAAHPRSERAPAAAYYRFKAAEALRGAGGGGADRDEPYLAAARAYLAANPAGTHAPEVRYRLGAYHHAAGDCARALEVLDAPAGDDPWSWRARFGVLQCRAEATRAAWRARDPQAGATYRASVDAVRAFVAAATTAAPTPRPRDATGNRRRPSAPGPRDDTTRRSLAAKASLLGGLLAAAAPTPHPDDVVDLLRGFEERFPNARELAADAAALRLTALARLGQVAEARADLDRLLALPGAPDGRQRLRRVGAELVRAAERTGAEARADLLRLAQHVYRTLVWPEGNGTDPLRPAGGEPDAGDAATLGQVSLALDDHETARRAYRQLLARSPDSLEAVRGLARAAERGGDAEEALARWRQVVERTGPGTTLWYEGVYHTALVEEGRGRNREACAVLRHAEAQAAPPAGSDLAPAVRTLRQRVCGS